MVKQTLLCVDDEPSNVEALERLFRKKYEVITCLSGKDAIEKIENLKTPLAAIITDQRMPEMTGIQVLKHSQNKFPETIRILLTGYTDIESVIAAVNEGQIYQYITKPWDPQELLATVDKAVEKFLLRKELAQKNIELKNALDELKSLDQAKSNFMILINHELKTPLTSILSFIELLRETSLNEEQDLYTNRIAKSADRLKKIIDDVLLIVKTETRQLKLKLVLQPLKYSPEDLFEDVKILAHQKLQKLKVQLPSEAIWHDVELTRNIFNRIVQNAVKFGPESSEIEIKYSTTENGYLIQIENTGPRIPESTISKLMRPFYLDENIMNHSTGLGLGLTICNSILQMQGSHLEIKNTDTGVRVSFELFKDQSQSF